MLTVLIVDDEIMARRGVAQGVDWERLGCRVAGEAANGEEGVALAEKLRPGLIITDIRMPRMDGVEMMNTLRARGCDAHVIVLTAYSDFPYVRGALKFGADDYLLKPFRNRELENAVQAICLKIEKSAPPPAQLVPLPRGKRAPMCNPRCNISPRILPITIYPSPPSPRRSASARATFPTCSKRKRATPSEIISPSTGCIWPCNICGIAATRCTKWRKRWLSGCGLFRLRL